MFALTRLRWPLAVIVAFVFAAILALVAFSSTASANHSWGSYHWAIKGIPFTLQLGDNVDSRWDSYLRDAAGYNGPNVRDRQNNSFPDWSDSSVLETPIVSGGTNDAKGKRTPKTCATTSGRVEVCNASYGRNGWLGIAGISVSGSHITQGYTKLNDSYFDTTTYNTPAWRRLVTCQELGHTFGLDHTDETFNNANLGSCMDYTNDPDGGVDYGADNQYPGGDNPTTKDVIETDHDYNQLELIYDPTKGGHSHDTTTVGQTSTQNRLPAAAAANEAARDEDGPGQWGRLIRQSPDGRLALYEKDLRNGHKFFRFVIWAVDAHQAKRDAHHD